MSLRTEERGARGRAERRGLYVSVFEDSEIERVERYGPGAEGAEGSVKRAAP